MCKIYYLSLLTFMCWLTVATKRTKTTSPFWNNCSWTRIQHSAFSGRCPHLGWSHRETSVDVQFLQKLSHELSPHSKICTQSFHLWCLQSYQGLTYTWIIWLVLFPVQLLAWRKSECSLCLRTSHESKHGFKDCWVCSSIYSEKSVPLNRCKGNTFSAGESKVLVVLRFEPIRVFNNLSTCRVSVAVGLRLSHHLNFSNELLMRGQLLMEIRKTFIEELQR